MITERNVIGKIEILEDGQIQLREDIVIERDGVEIFRLYHRRVLEPGESLPVDVNPRLRSVTDVIWTLEVVDAFRTKKNSKSVI